MKGILFVDNDNLGEVDFKVLDASMGVIQGVFNPNENYLKYKSLIQQHCDKKGISNSDDLNFRVFLSDNTEIKPEGGIGITDLKGFDEILVEAGGLDQTTLRKVQQ